MFIYILYFLFPFKSLLNSLMCCRGAAAEMQRLGLAAESDPLLDFVHVHSRNRAKPPPKPARLPFFSRGEKTRAFGLGPTQIWRCLARRALIIITVVLSQADRRGCLRCLEGSDRDGAVAASKTTTRTCQSPCQCGEGPGRRRRRHGKHGCKVAAAL